MVAPNRGSRLLKSYPGMGCHQPRVNSQWSVWYCILTLAFQIYIIANSIQRFTRYISLPWPPEGQPYFELNAYVAFIGAAVVVLPFFVLAAMMKVGNHANDGYKLGEAEPEMVVYQNLRGRKYFRWMKAVWRHGGPVAALLHLLSAICLLLPRLLIQAQLIKHGFLSKGAIWRTDLDFMITHKDRLVVLSFLETLNETEVWGRDSESETRPGPRTEVQLEEGVLISSEFINYILAVLVHAIRYPAVFWKVNKCFGLLFSGQLLLNGLQMLLAFTGFAVLYKVHIYGPQEVLLRFSSLLLSVRISMLLFVSYTLVLTASGSVLYMYGFQKFKEWQEARMRQHLITWRQESRRLWGYVPHLGAFFVLLAIALCAAPLMYDCTLVYCGSLDGAVLASVTGTVLHLFLWIVLWLVLTIKYHWSFSTDRYQVGRDLHLTGYKGNQEAPLLVIDNGQTYQVREKDSKKAILGLVHKSIANQKPLSPADDDDIYWLKPKPPSPKEPKESPEADRLAWLKTQRKSPGLKHKVIFEDGLLGSGTCRRTRSLKKSPKIVSRFKKQNVKFEDLSDSDDGDYATLRDMTVVREDGDGDDGRVRQGDYVSYNPLSGSLPKESTPTIARSTAQRTHQQLFYLLQRLRPLGGLDVEAGADDGDYENLLQDSPTAPQLRVPVAVHRGSSTPYSTRSADSGITKGNGEDGNVTPRSGSISESSTSPEKGTSESSSGVHSNASLGDKRSSSMENLPQGVPLKPTWKSMSLQRTAVPPNDRAPRIVLLKENRSVPRSFRTDSSLCSDHPSDGTVVIHRKPKKSKALTSTPEPFGRATNIRMTSFTDQPDFPTTVINITSPKASPTSPPPSGSHGSVSNPQTLPHLTPSVSPHLATPQNPQHQRRDSANYSLASSAESENCASNS